MRLSSTVYFALCCATFFVSTCFADGPVRIEGVVRDSSGAVVTGADVALAAGNFAAKATSDTHGTFSFPGVPVTSGTLDVTAPGFSEVRQSWSAGEKASLHLEITLQIASTKQQVVVSASRSATRLSETPGSLVLLSQEDVVASPTLMVDQTLQQVTGFSLFRRTDSRTTNPTSAGVSLRGLGASGPSRALVLEDDIPILDPFGAWVFWDRIPRVGVSSMEVFRGGSSDLYGSNALGGVVQIINRQPEAPSLSADFSYGNERTPNLSLWTATQIGKWDISGGTDLFRTDGYFAVPLDLRGTIDTPVDSEHATLDLRIGRQLGHGRIFGYGNFYTESRDNGTQVQFNNTQIGEGAIGVNQQFGSKDSLVVRVFGNAETYHQSFSSIASNRDSESLTNLQTVPSQQLGTAGQWTHLFGKRNTLIAGADIQGVLGTSNEQLFSTGVHTANNIAGGRQRTTGVFGEDIFRPTDKWTIFLGARFDNWDNIDGRTIRYPISVPGPIKATYFPDRSNNAFSPRLSVLRALNSHVSVTGSIYRAFRAPTLNELYRSFRLGSVVTQANAALIAEHLTGAEAGAKVNGWNGKVEARGTFFWSDIVDPVSNVTISSTSTLITRERENLGRTRSRGVELDGVIHVNQDIQITAGYAFTDATVLQFPANTSLIGLEIPQVPRNVFTWEARYWRPSRLMFSLQGRFVGKQFDDDQNQFPLNNFYTMDILIGRALTRNLQIYAAGQNITDVRYQVAKTPILNVGPPILFRAGIRLDFPGGR
jgi:outer membrane receptor protein involved in Fe transport